MIEEITLTTRDDVMIVADYYPAIGAKGIVLVHMMPSTKESWRSLAMKLQSTGFHVLAIDLRGHGKSYGGPDGYRAFSDEQHRQGSADVVAATEFLKNKNISAIYLGGASIGANLALQYAAQHADIKKIFLLSAGLDYRGVTTMQYASQFVPDQRVYFVAATDDIRSSGLSAADMAQQLYDACSAKKDIKIFAGAKHGTDILLAYPDLEAQLATWCSAV